MHSMTNERVLVTGASGLLGRYLLRTAPKNYNVSGTWCTTFIPSGYRLDVTDKVAVERVWDKFQPSIVIHCAAMGSVDYCETHWQDAWNVNVLGTRYILKVAKQNRTKVVFISTNAVFDGENAPYSESDERCPVNRYGVLKAEAEDWVTKYVSRYLIIRPILLYGWPKTGGRGNWVTHTLDALCYSSRLHIVQDTVTQPTYVEDCANAIWGLLRLGKDGIYHIGGVNRVSLYDFVVRVAHIWNLDEKLIWPVDSDFFKDMAPRPRDTTYDLKKLWDLNDETIRPSGVGYGLERMRGDAP